MQSSGYTLDSLGIHLIRTSDSAHLLVICSEIALRRSGLNNGQIRHSDPSPVVSHARLFPPDSEKSSGNETTSPAHL